MGKLAGIYKLTNTENGKSYVGQSIDLNGRMNKYKNGHVKGQAKIYRAINKYGFSAFDVEYIFSTEKEYKHLGVLYQHPWKKQYFVFNKYCLRTR